MTVNEPNLEDTMKILRGIAHYYESFHGVKIPEGILRQAVVLSERYITDRFLPDKAIDLIDEACSDMNLKDAGINRRQEISRELADYGKERELLEAVEEPNFERLDGLSAQGEPQLTMDNLARVIELWTKIPASKIREEEFKRLSELDQRLRTKIVGQDEAIDAVSAAIRRNRVGISPKRGEDGAGQAAGRGPVQRAGEPHPPGHVGVYGETLRVPDHRLTPGLRGLRRGRTADGEDPQKALLGGPL